MTSTRYYPVQGGGGEGEGTSILAGEPICCLGTPSLSPPLATGLTGVPPESTWNQRLGKGCGTGYCRGVIDDKDTVCYWRVCLFITTTHEQVWSGVYY